MLPELVNEDIVSESDNTESYDKSFFYKSSLYRIFFGRCLLGLNRILCVFKNLILIFNKKIQVSMLIHG